MPPKEPRPYPTRPGEKFMVTKEELLSDFTILTPEQVRALEGEPPKETPKRSHTKEIPLNETEAKKLGLIRLELQSFPKAQALIDQITNKSIDIKTPQGRKTFVVQWIAAHPSLPLPCVPDTTGDYTKGDYYLLERLQEGNIIKNIEGTPSQTTTHYETPDVLYVDSWQEEDYDQTNSLETNISPLLKLLLNTDGVINISRDQIDQALFQGDPSQGNKTPTHIKLLEQLNLNPKEYSLRLISYDEYARGSTEQNWGQKKPMDVVP